ncbi:MAG: hypothetical protein QOJ06_1170 [Pseudonocardiales bacterium]|jgi:hypothetical protein|nr:hypothetical protein [Pseudonocardiales bacterium]
MRLRQVADGGPVFVGVLSLGRRWIPGRASVRRWRRAAIAASQVVAAPGLLPVLETPRHSCADTNHVATRRRLSPEMTLGKRVKKRKAMATSTARDPVETELAEPERAPHNNAVRGMERDFANVATCCGTAVKYGRSRTGSPRAAPGHVHVRPAQSDPGGAATNDRPTGSASASAPMPSSLRSFREISRAISISIHPYSRRNAAPDGRRRELPPLEPPRMHGNCAARPPSPPWQATRAEPISTTLGVRRPRSCGLFVPVRPL